MIPEPPCRALSPTLSMSKMKNPNDRERTGMTPPSDRRGPKPLGDVLGSLFAAKGFARLRAASELEAAWIEAVGDDVAARTRVGGVRHGVLSITVAHPTLLEDLSAFRKPELLAALRRGLPDLPLHDLRFRVGTIDARPDEPPAGPPTPKPKRPRKRGG